MQKIKELLKYKRLLIFIAIIILVGVGFFVFSFLKNNKKFLAISSLSAINKVSKFLPITEDEKKELDVVNQLVQKLTASDNIERKFLILLQNNYELRPGGGFLGQYAIIKIKNGAMISLLVEDANLLDQRITADIPTPYPLKRMLQLKKWKFRDSNFSPDFPTNVEKAKYFMRLAGGTTNFDGVIAVNSDVFNNVLALTGPITVPGFTGEFNSNNGALLLEEKVEKIYIMNPEIDTQNRKEIMKKMAPIIADKLFNLGNVTKIAELVHNEMKNRNIMLNFTDPEMQKLAESVHWDGTVTKDWGGDYLMLVDANMGSLKTDYYMKREITYNVDLTTEKPTATLNILYKNTAPYGDWRTSDYHTYLRIYSPRGSDFLERQMIGYPNITEEFNKITFGVVVHVLIGKETNGMIKYELPETIDQENYKLLIQKQSGTGDIPVKVHLKTKYGEFDQEQILTKDLKFEFQKNQ